jgi:hypothetical protein
VLEYNTKSKQDIKELIDSLIKNRIFKKNEQRKETIIISPFSYRPKKDKAQGLLSFIYQEVYSYIITYYTYCTIEGKTSLEL